MTEEDAHLLGLLAEGTTAHIKVIENHQVKGGYPLPFETIERLRSWGLVDTPVPAPGFPMQDNTFGITTLGRKNLAEWKKARTPKKVESPTR